MGETTTYEPGRVVLVVSGFVATDFADGSFIKVAYYEDTWKMVIGADGKPTRVKSSNESGYFELTLKQSSPFNDVLSSIAQNDRKDGTATVTVALEDFSGESIAYAAEAWVVKPADGEFAKDLTNRVWKLDTGRLQHFIGGNH